MTPSPVQVLVVEDSPVVRMLLVHVLNADPRIRVLGTAADGEEAVEAVAQKRPDVVLMDVNMPKMDGFEATRRIMATHPVPIVICSAAMKKDEVGTTFRALEAGAVAFVDKPPGPGHEKFGEMVAELVQTVNLMAGVKVVKRWARAPAAAPAQAEVTRGAEEIRLVAIGASTGGPLAIRTVLAGLPKSFPAPLLIVQHIAAGFIDGMIDWLRQATGLPVQAGAQGAAALPGHVYLAPDGRHMGVTPAGRIVLSDDEPESGLRPAVSYLFRSVAHAIGPGAVGVLLTGMGRDGAEELRLLRDRGAVTIAQDKESSVVHGMPGEAIQLGAACYVLPPEGIAAALAALVGARPGSAG